MSKLRSPLMKTISTPLVPILSQVLLYELSKKINYLQSNVKGLILVNNIQNLFKNSCIHFLSKLLCNVLKIMKNQFSDFQFLRHGRFQIISIHSKKYIFLSLQMMRNILKLIIESWIFLVRYLVFELWSILYFSFVLHSGLERIQKKRLRQGVPPKLFVSVGSPAQAPDAFGLNPPSQLVIGNHWLAFLNQVRKNLLVASSLRR